jgi:DNA-binding MarR family transcriptional regulator
MSKVCARIVFGRPRIYVVSRYNARIRELKKEPTATRRTRSQGQLKSADYRLLAEFRHLLRQFLVFSEERALEIGLSAQQHQALLAIKGHRDGAPAIGDLAERLAIRHNSAVELVNRLVGAGYVVRHSDPADRRRVILALSRGGEAILEKLTAAHRTELRRMVPLLKPLLAQLQD